MLRIVIADDHELIRYGLRRIIEDQPGWEIVGEAADGKEAVRLAIDTKADVAVLDYGLPLLNGVEATRQIRAHSPNTEVLIFTMHENDALIGGLLRAGARGYVLKSNGNQQLLDAIKTLGSHRPFLANVSERLLQPFRRARSGKISAITSRERAVLQLVAEGHTNKQVAAILNISLKTVESHRAAIKRKLNLSSSAALVRYAVRNKIVMP
jgi:DNA-binding NarL/FixJ family response regulator